MRIVVNVKAARLIIDDIKRVQIPKCTGCQLASRLCNLFIYFLSFTCFFGNVYNTDNRVDLCIRTLTNFHVFDYKTIT